MKNEWIFVYGPPGAGKSSVGRLLAEDLQLPFVDLDAEIEQASGRPIPALFAEQGEAGFRQIERDLIERFLRERPGVTALGGGALLDEGSRTHVVARGPVICLSASLETLQERLRAAATERPLLAGGLEGRLANLLESRRSHYASFPNQVKNDDIPLSEAAWQAQVSLGCFHVRGMGAGYDVRVLPGGLAELGPRLASCDLRGPVALVCDEQVAALYAQMACDSLRSAGYEPASITIPAGEQHKTIETIQGLWQEFLQAGLERGSTVLALGGGVTGDLAGFAASTYLRGVAWVVAPTSLLAMVDAGLGGKTGADLPQGKNLVGAFYPPRLVLADPQVLSTLAEREKRAGMAEVVKAAIIADPSLFEACGAGWESIQDRWEEIVPRAMAVKVRLIQADPYEQGPRAALNLGHTVGHAIERVSNYQISHGEAVSIGLAVEARLAERIGLAQPGLARQIERALAGLGLPVAIPSELAWEAILSAMQVDKKRQAGSLRFALPAGIGDVHTGVQITSHDLKEGIGRG